MNNEKKIVLIGGTIDARNISKVLISEGFNVITTVTTKYGESLMDKNHALEIKNGKLDIEEMTKLISSIKPCLVIDASHPYAKNASINAMQACKLSNTKYVRYERQESIINNTNVIRVESFEQAAKALSMMEGNILLTIGSNNLETFVNNIPNYKKRLFVRVLPDYNVIKKCNELGLNADNIIAIKGPFSEAMNREIYKKYNAKILVTKDSGKEGGIIEKIEAANKSSMTIIVINRPNIEYGFTLASIDEVKKYIKENEVE